MASTTSKNDSGATTDQPKSPLADTEKLQPDHAGHKKAKGTDASTLDNHRLQALEASVQMLTEQLAENKEAENRQAAIYKIAEEASKSASLNDLCRALHQSVSELMYAENFIISQVEENGDIRFIYFEDTVDTYYPDWSKTALSYEEAKNTLSGYVIQTGEPLLVDQKMAKQMERDGCFTIFGAMFTQWLGVPLKVAGKVLGALVVQNYTQELQYSEVEKELLVFVSHQIATSLLRKRTDEKLQESYTELEARVAQRTEELSEANRILEQEIEEKEWATKVQQALFKISEVAYAACDFDELYRSIHEIIAELMYAENIIIALSQRDGGIRFVYFKDIVNDEHEVDWSVPKEAAKKTLSSYVIRTGLPLLVDRDTAYKMAGEGEFTIYGDCFTDWLGVPLKYADDVLGAIVVQNYTDEPKYSEKEKELLVFVSQHIATALQRKHDAEKLKLLQKELVEAAHVAGMSEIASGILHNVGNLLNSIGTSTEALNKTLEQSKISSLKRIVGMLENNAENLSAFLATDPKGKKLPEMLKALAGVLDNERASLSSHADSVRKCAHTISDVISTQQKYVGGVALEEEVVLVDIVEDALFTQQGFLERNKVKLKRDFQYKSFVRVQKSKLLNIFINLLKNAVDALKNVDQVDRVLTISIFKKGSEKVCVRVVDNGEGIAEENLARIFNHGFTTRQHGLGFGLHSCATSLTEMQAKMSVESDGLGKGASFLICFPSNTAAESRSASGGD